MAKPGTYARTKAREQRLTFVREQWRLLALLSLGYAAVGAESSSRAPGDSRR
jgi:hypothetical protein